MADLASPGYYESGQGNMGGTIWEYPDRYRENSPIFDFPRIETPLLIGIGSLDGNLVPAEAIVTALDRLGKHVEYASTTARAIPSPAARTSSISGPGGSNSSPNS